MSDSSPRTGLDHFRQAQHLLTLAGYHTTEDAYTAEPTKGRTAWLLAAQVHATLAQAAATALNDAAEGLPRHTHDAWHAALGELPPEQYHPCTGCGDLSPASRLTTEYEPSDTQPAYWCPACRTGFEAA